MVRIFNNNNQNKPDGKKICSGNDNTVQPEGKD
ncbi:hypothetical protein GGD38_000685 [Chitinophagaceae bacterium OAS944]|nr:hypothetical protein [Chitinophagaceae bacterium OAS944]